MNAITLDWCQIHCKIKLDYKQDETGKYIYNTENYELKPTENYYVEKLKAQTFHYKQLYTVYKLQGSEKIEYAQIQALPHVSFIPQNSIAIKINNRILYTDNYHEIIKNLITEFNFTFVNYSRLDFASDFNHFDGGLNPVSFINNIADSSFIFSGRKNQRFIASEGYELHRNGKQFNAIKLGSRKSDLTVQLYNKTKELQVKSSKPWIREFWQLNNLTDKNAPIWRLEFSMSKSDKSLLNFETGEIVADWKDINLICKENVKSIYTILYNQHFQVAENDKTKKQFCRMKKVVLLTFEKVSNLLKMVNDKLISTTYVKYRVKKLIEAITDYKEDYKDRCICLAEHVEDIITKHALKDWFKIKYGKLKFYYEC